MRPIGTQKQQFNQDKNAKFKDFWQFGIGLGFVLSY